MVSNQKDQNNGGAGLQERCTSLRWSQLHPRLLPKSTEHNQMAQTAELTLATTADSGS